MITTILTSNNYENKLINIKRLLCNITFLNDAFVLSCVINPEHTVPLQQWTFTPLSVHFVNENYDEICSSTVTVTISNMRYR